MLPSLLLSFLLSLHLPAAGEFDGDAPEEDQDDNDNENDSDDEWETKAWTPPPEGAAQVGVKVRAIYDYVGEDMEELSFKAGDILTQIEAEDEQGWCRGVHSVSGNSGLYPACYVEEVAEHDA